MSKVFTFYGAERGVGVSMAVQSAAQLIAGEQKKLRILLLNLQGRLENSYLGYQGVSIEELRDYLNAGVLDLEEVLAASKYQENFHVIGGLKTVGGERYYRPEMAAYLISRIAPEFDLILVDAGSGLDSGLTLGAVRSADKIMFVFSQREHVLRRAEAMRQLHGRLKLNFDFALCGRYDSGDPYTVSYLCSRLGIPRSSLLCAADMGERAGRLAESEGKTLLDYRDPRYTADILALSNRILAAAGGKTIEQKRKRDGKVLFRRVFGE